MRKKANSVDKNSPEYWAKMITGGRASLLLIVVLTVVNIVLLLVEADRYFVFSASIPYYLTAICMGMDSAVYGGIDAYTTGALIVSVIVVGIYLLCWALGKKKTGWLITALVLFSLDTVGLLVITFTLLEDPILNLMDIIFHALAVYELVMAVICAGKLKRQAAAETCSTAPEIY